ncbi:MAG: TIGR04283 family arsenosugar biosynthesis glycosyltransferase [Acidobacteria bacterium]|nr:TIGR04283 family arsenosugar biosynthesis glycosyltransferase [Acidobacteriota bacterium]
MIVSIVIPTFNEAEAISAQVLRCLALNPRPEVIVVDGASDDGTLARAQVAGARTLAAPIRGRAHQMNAGVAIATGDILVFLHADVMLPQAAYAEMRKALLEAEVIGGAFRRRFDHPSLLLHLDCRLADLRGRLFGIFLGDQVMFIRREVFCHLGGFPEIRLFEDLALSRRMAAYGATRMVRSPVIASGRRFRQEGNLRRLCRDLHLIVLYFAGVDPEILARRYYQGYFDAREQLPAEAAAAGRYLGGKP